MAAESCDDGASDANCETILSNEVIYSARRWLLLLKSLYSETKCSTPYTTAPIMATTVNRFVIYSKFSILVKFINSSDGLFVQNLLVLAKSHVLPRKLLFMM